MIILNNDSMKEQIDELNRGTVVAIGNFDGLHLGHMELIKQLQKVKVEHNLVSAILSFYPHPLQYLKNIQVHTILTQKEKELRLEQLNIEVFRRVSFNDTVSNYSPEEFVVNILKNEMNAKYVIVGEGYRFARNREGDSDILKDICKKYAIDVLVVKHKHYDEQKISSSNIRNSILNGDMKSCNEMLGYNYFVYGNVSHGKKIGRTIGFPTANLLVDKEKLLPPNGVYASITYIDNIKYKSVTNIGHNPTIDNGSRDKIIETHLFDYNNDLYSKDIKVELIKHLRSEVKFNGMEELKTQLEIDRTMSLEELKNS